MYERLLASIISGELPPGVPLVEARLAEDFGVSKTPVREALIRLQRDGLVEIEPYRGARVAEPSRTDVEEVLELRTCIEAHIAADLARRRPRATLRALERAVGRSRAALDAQEREPFVRSLIDFDEALVSGSRNSRMVRVAGELRNALALMGALSMRAPGRPARRLAEHEAILAALEAGDVTGAVAATERHIASVGRDVLEVSAEPVRPGPVALGHAQGRVVGRPLPVGELGERAPGQERGEGSSCRSGRSATASSSASQQNGAYWWLYPPSWTLSPAGPPALPLRPALVQALAPRPEKPCRRHRVAGTAGRRGRPSTPAGHDHQLRRERVEGRDDDGGQGRPDSRRPRCRPAG